MTPTPFVALAVGSNLGDRAANVRAALDWLGTAVLTEARASRLYETRPVDCPTGAPDFVNAAIVGRCALAPADLLACCQDLEVRMGRPRAHGYHENRTLDVDILLVDELTLATPRLTIPHPALTGRSFFLEPLAELAPDWRVPPDLHTVAAWWQRLARNQPG